MLALLLVPSAVPFWYLPELVSHIAGLKPHSSNGVGASASLNSYVSINVHFNLYLCLLLVDAPMNRFSIALLAVFLLVPSLASAGTTWRQFIFSGISTSNLCGAYKAAEPGVNGQSCASEGSQFGTARYYTMCINAQTGDAERSITKNCNLEGIYYHVIVSACPSGQSQDTNQYGDPCADDATLCQAGSLQSHCAVTCPVIHYSYTINGVKKSGTIGGGTVGYGQSCPQPSYPSGHDSGSICTSSNENDCLDDNTYHESEDVDQTIEDTTVTDNGDGSTTTTTSSTSTSSGGSNSGTGSNSGSSDGTVIDGSGNDITGDGSYEDTVNIGDYTAGVCDHGGLVDGAIGCDYVPDACGPDQVADRYGCIDIPTSEPPPDSSPGTETETTENADGSSTTTTTTSTGSGESQQQEEESNSSASGGADCAAPPTCDGDPIACKIAEITWREACGEYDDVQNALDCGAVFVCEGDPVTCSVAEMERAKACAVLDGAAADSAFDTLATTQGLKGFDDVLAEQTANGYQVHKEIDVSTEFADLDNIATTSGTCPDDLDIDLGATMGTVSIPISQLCTLLTWIGYLVRLGAGFVGFNMIFATIRSL